MSLRLPPEQYALLVKQVLNRDGYKCRSCRSRNNLHVHHLQYRSQQGPDASWNLITLCNGCHDAVHSMKLGIGSLANADKDVTFHRAEGWKPK